MQVWSVTACGRERGRQRERKRVLLCVCVCPRPCVTLLPLMSPFTLQPNLLNTAARTHIRGDAGTRDAASNPLAISPMESNTHTHCLTHTPHTSIQTHLFYLLSFFFSNHYPDSLTYMPIVILPPHTNAATQPIILAQCILVHIIYITVL